MNPEEIQSIAEEHQKAHKEKEHHICVCTAAACLSANSDKVLNSIAEEVKNKGLQDSCEVKGVGCLGLCSKGPLLTVDEGKTLYQNVTEKDAEDIVKNLGGKPVKRLKCSMKIPFFQQQKKIVLENSGVIDPEKIEDAIAVGGYDALIQALTNMSPSEVIEEIFASGLRGRGGAGYPTGLKWSTVSKAFGNQKYIVCNADEGDPGAFMDRSILESDPHRVLEGMALAAYAVGADHGYIYIRAEYPLAIKRLRLAIRQAERLALLGKNIMGTPFGFHIDVRLGAGAFVCGEETALIASIEGHRGSPKPRPPYPAESGVWGKPTLINNVETFANIAPIIRNGAEWFSEIGSEKSKGTKVFALAGCINNTGLIEVPMGMSLREIIFEIGEGIPGDKPFKAVQTGGPSGGCIPEEHLDTPVDYDSLSKLGSIMGSGGMIIMDKSSSMLDVAKYFMEFCMSESCGKCVPCRVGTDQMHTLLDRISQGKASRNDLELLEELCKVVKNTSLCGLGQTAPNPVISTLRFFRKEYESKLVEVAEAVKTA